MANPASADHFKTFISEICQNQAICGMNSICCQTEQPDWQLLPEKNPLNMADSLTRQICTFKSIWYLKVKITIKHI
jgi:hypothetical protein